MSKPQSSIKLISFVIFLLISHKMTLLAQTKFENKISGRIANLETGAPLLNVNVFLANTTRGDATDKDGYYLIENIPPGAYDLVFSMIGYELKIVPVQFIETKSIKFDMKLRPQVIKGKEIEVQATVPKEWRKNLEKFTREFLGETKNAKKCSIINPEVLDFQTDQENKKFIAVTDSILIVENRSLGYRTHIILDAFRISEDSLIYSTYPRFEELISQDEQESRQWLENRRKTYKGSFRHFLSSLARGILEHEYFALFTIDGNRMRPNQLSIIADTSLALKWFYSDQPLEVVYRGLTRSGEGKYIQEWGGSFPSSCIYLSKGYAQIDTLGNVYTKYAFVRSGYWHNERYADLLPFDYIPDFQSNK
jgi:hypothetical protein